MGFLTFIKKLIYDTIIRFIEKSREDDLKRMLYFPLVYGVSYCLGSIFVVVTPFRLFFRAFDIYWMLNFSFWRIACSIIIGAIVSYASLSIVGKSVWANCFIFLFYIFVATGPMMSSKLLPFSFGKFMFISYYFLTFTEINARSTFYSPIVHLKFCLASILSVAVCAITCIIFRMRFGKGLFIKTTINIFKEIKMFIRESQLEMKLIVDIKNNDQLQQRNLRHVDLHGIHIIHSKHYNLYQHKKHLRSKLDYHYYEYSRLLNKLDSYLTDTKKEFGDERIIIHYEKVQILLERNHKKLFAIVFGFVQDITLDLTKKLHPLLPLIDILVTETENIFNTMENQLQKKYIHNDNHQYKEWMRNNHDLNLIRPDYDESLGEKGNGPFYVSDMNIVLNLNHKFKENSLEWQQQQINQSFKRVDEITKILKDSFDEIFHEKIFFNSNQENYIVSTICFSVEGFISFTEDQKFLSKQVFLIAYHYSTHRFIPREIDFIIDVFNRFRKWIFQFTKKRKVKKDKEEYEKYMFNLNYTIGEKLKTILKYILFKRILFNWVFSLKYALVISSMTVSIYEIQKHSDFILFRRLGWALDTFIVLSSPDIGAIGYRSVIRIIGTIIGGFSAYVCVVLSKLGQSSVASGFIYLGYSFCFITLASFLVQHQQFDSILMIIVFTYTVISVPQFHDRREDIIQALFKILFVTIGVVIVLLIALIIPYFDYRQLEQNLYKIPERVVDMVHFLFDYSFNLNIPVKFNDEFKKELIPSPSSLKIPFTLKDSANYVQVFKNNNLTFREYRALIGQKYIKLRRIFPHQRQLLIEAGFELVFQFNRFKKIEHILQSCQELHNLFGALEFMMIQLNDQNAYRSIGYLSKEQSKQLLDNLLDTSELLAKLPPLKDNLGKSSRESSDQQLTVDQDNSIFLCDELIDKVKSIINSFDFPLFQYHRINSILYALNCFVQQYHSLYTELVDYKNIIVVDKLNNNNYRNTDSEKDLKQVVLDIKNK